ncbi:ribonuclease H-like domain-containing protein [Tanacetum coccineum]
MFLKHIVHQSTLEKVVNYVVHTANPKSGGLGPKSLIFLSYVMAFHKWDFKRSGEWNNMWDRSRHRDKENVLSFTDYEEGLMKDICIGGGKFDGKADEGFFVGYSINSKAFRVFNSRTRIVEENLHVQFSENTPNIAGSGPN